MEYYKNFKLKSFVVILCVFTAVFANLIPNYSDPAKKIVYFDERDSIPLVLTCIKPEFNGTYNIKWKKDGKWVNKSISLRKWVENNLLTSNSLVMFNPTADDAGNYTCIIPDSNPVEEADIEVVTNVYVEPLPLKTWAVRTKRLEIHCKAHGTNPKIKWTIDGKEISNRTHIKLTKGFNDVENSTLVIENVERNDHRSYVCAATNKATGFEYDYDKKYMVSYAVTIVKVRGTVWGGVVSIFNWFF